MCGFVGFAGPPDPEVLRSMRDAIAHRGPDAAGEFWDDRVSLGHRRLSIVDIAGGSQPMFNDDRSLVMVYNGEIYNHLELRRRFLSDQTFRSTSDTETLLRLYEKLGSECVTQLRGMFAFVIYDIKKRLLFGGRDPMGEKPLYATAMPFGDVSIAFASESKAFARHPMLKPAFEINHDAVRTYLLHDYTTGRDTINRGIQRIPAGCTFVFHLEGNGSNQIKFNRYWNLNFTEQKSDGERFVPLLDEAVHSQLMSDVPLGIFMSGGIDSSTIAALLARRRPPDSIKAFSIGFDDPSFDETSFARQAAEVTGVRFHHRYFSVQDLLDRLPRIAGHLDEPFADPSILPVSLLSEFAREHVTVALGGDGGDELLAGYDPFLAVAPMRVLRWAPSLLAKLMDKVASMLATSDRNMGTKFRALRFLRGASVPPVLQCAAWMGPFSWHGLRTLCPDLMTGIRLEDAYRDEIELADECRRLGVSDDMTLALDFFQRIYLADDILVKVDRAAMMHSLEVRCPFLDRDLVAYANHLPVRLKLSGRKTKVLLKREIERQKLLPREIIHRKKKGFGVPVARWLKSELKPEFEARVIHGWPSDLPPLASAEVQRLWRQHLAGHNNNYKELWALLMLAWWRQSR